MGAGDGRQTDLPNEYNGEIFDSDFWVFDSVYGANGGRLYLVLWWKTYSILVFR